MASCRPSMRVCPDIPASTQDHPASTRQAPTKTGAQAQYHDTLTAAPQQPTTPAWTGRHCLHNPGNTQNAFAADGSGWVHGRHHCGRSPNRLSDTSRKTSGLCPFRPPALQNLRRLT